MFFDNYYQQPFGGGGFYRGGQQPARRSQQPPLHQRWFDDADYDDGAAAFDADDAQIVVDSRTGRRYLVPRQQLQAAKEQRACEEAARLQAARREAAAQQAALDRERREAYARRQYELQRQQLQQLEQRNKASSPLARRQQQQQQQQQATLEQQQLAQQRQQQLAWRQKLVHFVRARAARAIQRVVRRYLAQRRVERAAAALVIQQAWRRHRAAHLEAASVDVQRVVRGWLVRRQLRLARERLAQLDEVARTVDELERSRLPAVLAKPVLDERNRVNYDLLALEEHLIKLQLRADGVLSDGHEDVRLRRKAVVKRINALLAALDRFRHAGRDRVMQSP